MRMKARAHHSGRARPEELCPPSTSLAWQVTVRATFMTGLLSFTAAQGLRGFRPICKELGAERAVIAETVAGALQG